MVQSVYQIQRFIIKKVEMEQTFIMIKPDGVQRGLVGKIILRFEEKGYHLAAMKQMYATEHILNEHYKEHVGKQFFDVLVKYILSGPVICMVWEGKNAVATGRTLLGDTDPLKSSPGTIRGDYGLGIVHNMLHGSDSLGHAQNQIKLWFKEEEIVQWKSHSQQWIYQ